MNKKSFLLFFVSFVLFYFFYNINISYAATSKDAKFISGMQCFDDLGETDAQFKARLAALNVPYSLTIKNPRVNIGTKKLYLPASYSRTFVVDKDVFYNRRIVVYNYEKTDVIASLITKDGNYKVQNQSLSHSICEKQAKRYIGLSSSGIAIMDPISDATIISTQKYFMIRKFIKHPWEKIPYIQSNIRISPKIMKDWGEGSLSSAEKKSSLTRAMDGASLKYALGRGKDHTDKTSYSMDRIQKYLRSTNLKHNFKMINHLSDYSVVGSKLRTYTPGVYYTFIDFSVRPMAVNFIASKNPIVTDKTFDASVSITDLSPIETQSSFNPTLTIKLTGSDFFKLKSKCQALPPKDSRNAKTLYCKNKTGNRTLTGVTLYKVGSDGKTTALKTYKSQKKNSKFVYSLDTTTGKISFTLKDYLASTGEKMFNFKTSGSYAIKAWIPYYVDSDSNPEEKTSNNTATKKFNFDVKGNVALSGTTDKILQSGEELKSVFTVSSTFPTTQSSNINVVIKNIDGTSMEINKTGSNKTKLPLPFSVTSSKNKIVKINKSAPSIVLPPGHYKLYAEIPRVSTETDLTDNKIVLDFEVQMFIPDNTTCDFANTKYITTVVNPTFATTALDVSKKGNENKAGVARTCIGYTPKYPSTIVEGGQKTYFYVAYKALAFPLPAYYVKNNDKFGINQELTIKEPKDALGSCVDSLKAPVKTEISKFDYDQTLSNPSVALSKCNTEDTFYHFPTKYDSSFASSTGLKNYSDWLGPYRLGAYDYYHNAYRGRLLPQSVTLDVKVLDTEEKVLSKSTQLGFGSMTFFMDSHCYNLTDANAGIDIQESCRIIQLYLPGNEKSFTLESKQYFELPTNAAPFASPEDDEKLSFRNVGLHAVEINIKEEHVYIYQKDEGSEFQGSVNTKRAPRAGENDSTAVGPVETTNIKKSADGTHYIQTSEIKTSTGNGYANHCYSPENASSTLGTWNQTSKTFTQDASGTPYGRSTCFHDTRGSFYYWMYNWSTPRSLDSFYLFNHNFTPTPLVGGSYKQISISGDLGTGVDESDD